MIPPEYLDGCTLFPNSFGKISHFHVCNDHDIAYWTKRTYTSKIRADIVWWWKILNIHRNNTWYWIPVAWMLTTLGLLVLLTAGNIPWYFRHRWDKKYGQTDDKE